MGVAIPLTQGKVAIVDEADAEMVSRYRWCYLNVGYAARHERIDGKDRMILMHRFLLGASPEQLVDHINGNGLDNRRENIRLCTKADNQRNQRRNSKNTTGYKGVSFDKARGKYIASIQVLGTQIHLGRFSTAEEASKAYEEAASRYHGEFAYAHSASSVPAVPSDGAVVVATRPTFSSRYRGVSWKKQRSTWVASIGVAGRQKHLGVFATEQDAARAYNAAAIEHYGDKAILNEV